jgi:phosphate starvation-inducible protein PhoH and related proteins
MDIHERKITLKEDNLIYIMGHDDKFLQLIENKFHSLITIRGNNVIVKGTPEEIKSIEKIFKELEYLIVRNGVLNLNDVKTVIGFVEQEISETKITKLESDANVFVGINGQIRCRTRKQQDYYNKVQENDLVFSIGPAGTGKTYLAVAMALSALRKNEISKIILSRPAVEAGESLGFLPGDLGEKLDPYLKPLTDALYEMVNAEKLKGMMDKNIIEIIPLAYMRGRTLNNAFIILDEAQNATNTQMKMFLTRLGVNSKAIVNGDITQIDLVNKDNSGLINARDILKNIKGIHFVYFSTKDVVRHKLVAEIIKAYDKESAQKAGISQIETETGEEINDFSNKRINESEK